MHLQDAKRFEYRPIEYKRGKPKPGNCDTVQLCAQAMCLEEMYQTNIGKGYIYYGETRHRTEVQFTVPLRNQVKAYCLHMHELYKKAQTPPPIYKPHCKSCSLFEICLPKKFSETISVNEYLNECFNN